MVYIQRAILREILSKIRPQTIYLDYIVKDTL